MINYNEFLTGVKSPMDQAMAGYGQGIAIRKEAEKEEAIQAMASQEGGPTAQQSLEYSLRNPEAAGVLALNAKDRALAQQAQAQVKKSEEFQKDYAVFLEDPSVKAAALLRSKHPKFTGEIDKGLEGLDEEHKQGIKKDAMSLDVLLEAENKDLSIQMLDRRIQKAEESGNEDFAAGLKATKLLVENGNFKGAQGVVANTLAGMMDEKEQADYIEARSRVTARQAQATADKTRAETAGILAKDAREEAEALKGPEMSGEVKKIYRETQKDVNKTRVDYRKASNLLDEIPVENIGGLDKSAIEKLGEWWSGGTADVQAWKQKLENFKMVDILANKPPGPMSEGELDVLSKAVPSDSASPEVVAEYIQAAKRVMEYNYAHDKAKLKFLAKNNDVTPATKDFEIFGLPVKAGEDFEDFIARTDQDIYKISPDGSSVARKAPKASAEIPSSLQSIINVDR